MRIEHSDTIRIAAGPHRNSQFGALQKGDLVTGRIIERVNPRQAVIEIGGNRLTADFVNGVPREGRITLLMEGQDGQAFFFRRINRDDPRFYRDLFRLTIFDAGQVDKKNLSRILTGLKKEAGGLFEVSEIIMRNGRGSGASVRPQGDFASLMRHFGLSGGDVSQAAFLVATLRNQHLPFALTILRSLGFEKAVNGIMDHFSEDTVDDRITEVIQRVEDTLEKDGNGRERFREFLQYLFPAGGDDDAFAGELPCQDDPSGPPIRYLVSLKGCVVSFSLTNIGPIEILLQDLPDEMRLAIACEDDEVKNALAVRINDLHGRISGIMNKAVVVDIYKRRDVLEKIIEIISSSTIHSVFDARA
jgi:hypothetical protein